MCFGIRQWWKLVSTLHTVGLRFLLLLRNTVDVAIPIATRGLKLDDEVARAAVIRLRLGLDLCLPHQYHCGSFVDARWLHSLVSYAKEAPGRSEIPRQVLDRHAVGRILTLTILPMSSE